MSYVFFFTTNNNNTDSCRIAASLNQCTANTKAASESHKAMLAPPYNSQPPALQPLQAFQRALNRSGFAEPHYGSRATPPALVCPPWVTFKTKNSYPQTTLPLGRHHQQLTSGGQETSSENPPAGKRAGGSVKAQSAPLRRPVGPGTTACKITGLPLKT